MHFTVAVFHNEDELVEDILAPYEESNTRLFSEFEPCGEISDIRKELEQESERSFGPHSSRIKEVLTKSDKAVIRWYLEENNYVQRGDEYGYIYNPRSQWDWWTVGGRWSNYLADKNGNTTDTILAKDFDFEKSFEAVKEEWKKIWLDEEAKIKKNPNLTPWHTRKPLEEFLSTVEWTCYGVAEYGDFITYDDSDEFIEEFNKRIKENPEKYITIVDCHV